MRRGLEPIALARHGEIVMVTLQRPERLNALDERTVVALGRALEGLREDAACRVVVLTGEGRAFCSGLDLKNYHEDAAQDADRRPAALWAKQTAIARLVVAVHNLPQPVVAAVNGVAAGAGLALACACDIRVATSDASFIASFINVGYSGCDLALSWTLPRLVGAGRAHELMLTGRPCSAAEAQRIGLVTAVGSDVRELALDVAGSIARHPPLSVQLTKAGMWLGLEVDSLASAVEVENRQQVLVSMTEEAGDARRAFLDRERPTT